MHQKTQFVFDVICNYPLPSVLPLITSCHLIFSDGGAQAL